MNDEQIRKELGLRIKSYRANSNLTQENLGSIIGIEQANVSNFENGKTYPDTPTLCALISKTDMTPDFLFGFLKNNKTYSTVDYEVLDLLITAPNDVKIHLKNLLLSILK